MKSKIIQMLGDLGGYKIARSITRNQPKVLMYHRFSEKKAGLEVSAATFEQQLKIIKHNFNPMTLADLASYREKNLSTPVNAVVITVDDGYRDFYEVAYPLLAHYKIPATFFVTTGFINGDIWLWPDQVDWILTHKQSNEKVVLAGREFDLSQPAKVLWWPIVGHFLQIPDAQRIEALTLLEQRSNIELPKVAPQAYSAVNWTQLAEMQNNGIEIGGHTVNHPSLGAMTTEDARREIFQSYTDITHELGERPRTFCYPNGQPSDYSEDIKNIVRESPYLAAVTAFSDKFNTDLNYAWRRFVGCEDSFQFHKSLFGVEHLGNRIRGTSRAAI